MQEQEKEFKIQCSHLNSKKNQGDAGIIKIKLYKLNVGKEWEISTADKLKKASLQVYN